MPALYCPDNLAQKSRRESQLPSQKEKELQQQNVVSAFSSPQTHSTACKGKVPKTTALDQKSRHECVDNSTFGMRNDTGNKEVANNGPKVDSSGDKESFDGNQQILVSSNRDSTLSETQERDNAVMAATQAEEAVSSASCEKEKQEENHDLAVKESKSSLVDNQKYGSQPVFRIVEVDQSKGCQSKRRPEGTFLSVVDQTHVNERKF